MSVFLAGHVHPDDRIMPRRWRMIYMGRHLDEWRGDTETVFPLPAHTG